MKASVPVEAFTRTLSSTTLKVSAEVCVQLIAFTGKRLSGMPATYPLREEESDSPIVVPFTYESSVWMRVMAKIAAEPTFKKTVESAEGMELYSILSNTGIDEDRTAELEVTEGHYVKPEGKIDLKKGTLSFTFPFQRKDTPIAAG